mgnify:CR=1 FL=1
MDPVSTFRAEAKEHLDALEQALLDLEQQPDNAGQIAAAFRAMHTIKGSAGLFGLDVIVAFTHIAESVLDRVREGDIEIDSDTTGQHPQALDEAPATPGTLNGEAFEWIADADTIADQLPEPP